MIEYIDDLHLYLADGLPIPSVSQLVQEAIGNEYQEVPQNILRQAAEYGTQIHNAIEIYFKEGVKTDFKDPYMRLSFENFLKMHSDYLTKPISEMIVDFSERYAGRIDALENEVLVDYKTSTVYPKRHLEYQLSFYAMALEQKGYNVQKMVCLWLPKRKSGQWIEVKRIPNEELLEVLERYEINHPI